MTPDPRALFAVAQSLAVDTMTAGVCAALDAAGVGHVLIKGPTVARWIYDDHHPRTYCDADLLLEPQAFARGEQVLTEIGFRPEGAKKPPPRGLPHSEPWTRGPAEAVDVHRTLFGTGASPERVWQTVAAGAGRMVVGGVRVCVPSLPARALIVALHAAQHGDEPGPRLDLERAVARVDVATWRAAAALADRLHASHTFAAGLRRDPAGARLADTLGLMPAALAAAEPGAPLVAGLDRLAATRGTPAKLALLSRELVPAPDELRWWSPLARRGRAGLMAAYVWRPVWIALQLPGSVRAWRAARRTVAQ